MLHETYAQLANRLTEEVHRHYGSRLVSVVLYGSVARGTMRPDSDIDVLIVAVPLPERRLLRVREFEAVEQAMADDLRAAAEAGVQTCLSPVFKTAEEVEYGSPLFLDMTLEARILYDQNGFFAAYLERLRERLRALGSTRKALGGGYYWILKPDRKPGEEIVL